jgi:hypothetical protein
MDPPSSRPHHQYIYDKLNYFLESGKIPNIIFHGPFKSGKKNILNEFLKEIYQNDKHHLKVNVMNVNCCYGKGIKFIREELKHFAKINIQQSSGVLFKSVILLNADCLTIDAQSALRRCIELFTHNTRFFLVVEKKHKLLVPILSRFCEIYVPPAIMKFPEREEVGDTTTLLRSVEESSNLPSRATANKCPPTVRSGELLNFSFPSGEALVANEAFLKLRLNDNYMEWDTEHNEKRINIDKIDKLNETRNQYEKEKHVRIVHFFQKMKEKDIPSNEIIEVCKSFYDFGISALELSNILQEWNEGTIDTLTNVKKNELQTFFHRIKGVYRCEKMIMFIFFYAMNDLMHGRELTYDTNFQIYKFV